MSVLTYRYGCMAADSAVITNSSLVARTQKIFKRGQDGALMGICGDIGTVQRVLEWFLSDDAFHELPPVIECDTVGIIVRDPQTVWHLNVSQGLSAFEDLEYYAVGSGRDLALGAMHGGADAYKACQAACAHDCHCELPIQFVRFGLEDGETHDNGPKWVRPHEPPPPTFWPWPR